MIQKIIQFSFLMLLLISCKDDVKKEPIDEKKNSINEKCLSVVINAVVKKDDSFQVYYKDEDKIDFDEKKSIYAEFKGNEAAQDIIFNLPEDELPNFLRIDFGTNKGQLPIKLNYLKLNYYGKNTIIKGKDFASYFYHNDLTSKFDTITGIITPLITKEGNYDPMFASAEGLKKQIELITRK